MLSPISKALSDIHFSLPEKVLVDAFINTIPYELRGADSVDGYILSTVIRPRVLIDLNLVAGRETLINLSQCEVSSTYDEGTAFTVVFKVPKVLTNGRSIVSALSVQEGSTGYIAGNGGACNAGASTGHLDSQSSLLDLANRLNNPSGHGFYNVHLEVIGENLIMVKYLNKIGSYGFLRARIENEANLSNLQPAFYSEFSTLCIYAVKSYIYNKFLLIPNKGSIYGGHELGALDNYIDSLSDSEELYREYLSNVIPKIMLINDDERHSRYIKSIMGRPS